jgi:hypothetical protein
MSTFVSPFTGTVVVPTDVSYQELVFSVDQDLFWPSVVNPTQVPLSRIMDCTSTAANLHINLPQGNLGATGSDTLIRNFGLYEFSVVDYSGLSSVLVQPGEAKYFYLSDNATVAGTWQNVTFGAGTAAADAATLQGAGLTTINGRLATTQNIILTNATPSVTDLSRANTFVWTGGAGTLTLPLAANLSQGWYICFRNNGTGTLTITPQSGSLINSLTTITANPNDSGIIMFQDTTSNFFTVGLAPSPNITFSSAVYDVDSIVGNTFSLVSYAPIIQTYISISGTRTQTLAVTLPATTQLYILTNNTGSTAYDITFQVSGSSSPPLVVASGSIVTVLSDGNNLYTLTQTTVSTFYATNGSASLPAFSFISDNYTGMYLVGTSILGLTANGNEILNLDGTNTLNPVITTPATFNAGLITGGTF